MSFSKLSSPFELLLVTMSAIVLFLYSPLLSISLLLIYSLYRNTYYLLAIVTFLYDILFANFIWSVPKLSLMVLLIVIIIDLILKKMVRNVRNVRRIDYDF